MPYVFINVKKRIIHLFYLDLIKKNECDLILFKRRTVLWKIKHPEHFIFCEHKIIWTTIFL